MTEPQKIQVGAGMVVLTTYGMVTAETAQSLLEMRAFCERNGLRDIMWTWISGALVDKTRNEGVRTFLGARVNNQPLHWLVFIDCDMTFQPNVLDLLLATAYQQTPWADIVGAYCQLRGKPYLPTTDYGSGLWEASDPHCGPLEVIRTGSACILIKRPVYEKMEFPWYGVRPAPRPIDMLTEVDNFARIKMDGENPLREHPAWSKLETCAIQDAQRQQAQLPPNAPPGALFSSVGEDSSFCDRARALGFRIVVQTDAVVGHLDRNVITPDDHKKAMQELEQQQRWATGVLV